jgi:HEAT repeat protein
VEALAALGTPGALEGLLEAYGGSARATRAEILRALPGFCDEGDAGATALAFLQEQVAQLVTGQVSAELTLPLLEGLGGCRATGRDELVRLVRSELGFAVREPALDAHGRTAGEPPADEDVELWEEVFDFEPPVEGAPWKRGRGPVYSHGMRLVALEALAPTLDTSDLVRATRDGSWRVQRAALLALETREDDRRELRAAAKKLIARKDLAYGTRVEATRIMLEGKGAAAVAKDASKLAANAALLPPGTREDLADLLREYLAREDDRKLRKTLVKWLGRGDAAKQTAAVRALASDTDPEIAAQCLELVDAGHPGVRRSAIHAAIVRGGPESEAVLERVVDDPGRGSWELLPAIEALAETRGDDPAWREQLRALLEHGDVAVRNAAFEQITALEGDGAVPLLEGALANEAWSTRLLAVRALAHVDPGTSIPMLVDALEAESHRRIADETQGTLRALTGQRHVTPRAWRAWWNDHAADYLPPDAEVLAELERERRAKRREDRSSTFFGVRVDSDHVVFVIDVSGSMQAPLPDSYGSEDKTRFDVVRQELLRSLDEFPASCRFTIVTFSHEVHAFSRELLPLSDENRAAAVAWVEELQPDGGTNIHDAVRFALTGTEADTVILLSDGEPSYGPLIVPERLRREIGEWNRHRGAVIHTVSIATNIELLRWIAEDSGGDHVRKD